MPAAMAMEMRMTMPVARKPVESVSVCGRMNREKGLTALRETERFERMEEGRYYSRRSIGCGSRQVRIKSLAII